MNIDEILDKLDDAMEEAWTLPLSKGRRVVDADKIQDLLDDIRLNLPAEIRQAKAIVNDRGEIVTSAKKEADAILEKAKDRAAILVIESEIVKEAQRRGNEMLEVAKKNATEIKIGALQYSEKTLKAAEEQMIQSVSDIRQAMGQLRKISDQK